MTYLAVLLNLAVAALYVHAGQWDVAVTCGILAATAWWLERKMR